MGLAHSWGGKEKNQGKVNLQRKGKHTLRERKDDRESMERKKKGKGEGKKSRLGMGEKREGKRAYLHIALPRVKRRYH